MLSSAGAVYSAPGRQEPKEAGFNPRRTPRYGVAMFTNPNSAAEGWACAADGDTFHFTSPHELDTDTVWVTNLSFKEFLSKGKNFSHLRGEDYLSVSPRKIAEDLGHRSGSAFNEEACSDVARIIQKAIITAINVYDWNTPDADLKSDTLAEDIRRSIALPPKPQAHMLGPLGGAFQATSKPEWPVQYEPNTISVTLRQNRLDFAQKLLAAPVPDDGWTYIGPDARHKLTLDRLLDPRKPTLVEATVELSAADPDMAALCAFGTTSEKRSTAARRWISQPELEWLSRYATVRVHSAFEAMSSILIPRASRLPEPLVADPFFSLSLSAGIVADAHVQALCAPTRRNDTKTLIRTSWSIWIKALDRALSFQLALAAHQAGFKVFNYGRGAVVLNVDKGRLPELLEFAEDNHFTHPVFYPLFKEHGLV